MILISPKKVVSFLALFIFGFAIANVGVQYSMFILDRGGLWGLSKLFDIDMENNLPTWYSSCALLACGVLLGFIAAAKHQERDRYFKHWYGLAGIFLWLSADESASIHELFIQVGDALNTSGFLTFFWVVPAIIAVIVVAIIYKDFLLHLPLKTRQLVLFSISIYLIGAIGMEMIGGYYIGLHPDVKIWSTSADWVGMGFELILAIEESLEMLGIAGLIYTLLSYMREEVGSVTIQVLSKTTSQDDRPVKTKNITLKH